MAMQPRGRGWMGFLTLAGLLVALLTFLPACQSSTGDDGAEDARAGDSDSGDGEDSESGEDAKDGKNGKDGKEEKETPVPVEVAALANGEIESFIRSTANLEAEHEVKIFSQAARQVVERHVEEGSRVKEGDLLLRLQDDEQRSAAASAAFGGGSKMGRSFAFLDGPSRVNGSASGGLPRSVSMPNSRSRVVDETGVPVSIHTNCGR